MTWLLLLAFLLSHDMDWHMMTARTIFFLAFSFVVACVCGYVITVLSARPGTLVGPVLGWALRAVLRSGELSFREAGS
jgi:hypothetical protein